ncbi:MAG TPA: ABC transporter permease subunit/CPBP intramembrane protease [Humisphaera sp.]
MRTNIVAAVFRKELREMLRDRRSLLIMFGVPLVLYPLITVALGGLTTSQDAKLKETAARVVVRNGAAAPNLVGQLRKAGSGFEVVDGGAVAAGPATAPASSGAPPTTTPATSPATQPVVALPPPPELDAGTVDAVLDVPPGAEAAALAGGQPEFVVTVNRVRFRSAAATERKLDAAMRAYERWVLERRLAGRGVGPDVLSPLKTRTVDVATGRQRLGGMMATMLPLFILLTGTLGAFFPAINATTTERERGTMETLLATPAGRTEILLGKGLLVLLGGLLTAGLNLASMALVLRWLFAGLSKMPGAADLSIDPWALVLSYLAAVPTLVFVTALVMVAGLFARTFQEANALALPVMLLPLASAAIGLADPATTPGLLLTPIANTTVIIRDVLTGRATAGAFLLAGGASCLYAGLLVSAASRVFNAEQLVNPSWEPLSLKGLGRRGRPRRPRPPAVDVALALFAVTLLLTLYAAPAFLGVDLLVILLVTSVGLLAVPTLLTAWVSRWPWVETFSFRVPSLAALAGGLLLGAGLVPVVNLLYVLQNKVWPASPEAAARMLEQFLPSVRAHPVLTPIVLGLLAGVCEELLYRGPIQAALVRKLRVWPALAVGAALFAAAHLELHGAPLRFGLGLLLGYVVWRGGSVFPAMLLHAAYDAAQVGQLAWAVHTQGVASTAQQAAKPAETPMDATFWLTLAVGAALAVVGAWLLRAGWRRTAAVPADAAVTPAGARSA